MGDKHSFSKTESGQTESDTENGKIEAKSQYFSSDEENAMCLESEEEQKKSAKDSGYAWVIVVASFFAFFISGGLMRTEGIFYVTFKTRYSSSAQLTAWLGAVGNALQNFAAPFTAAFINRYSVRASVILGAFCLSSGFLLTSVAPSVYWLFFTYSVLVGLGRCLVMTASFISINMFFNKRRGMALALATSGWGFGGLVMLPLLMWLLDTYLFPGTLLILSGLVLNVLVCGFLLRPFSLHQKLNRPALTNKTQKQVVLKPCKESSLTLIPNHDSVACSNEKDKNELNIIKSAATEVSSYSTKPLHITDNDRVDHYTEVHLDLSSSESCSSDEEELFRAKGKRKFGKNKYRALQTSSRKRKGREQRNKTKDGDSVGICRSCISSIKESFSICFPVDMYNPNNKSTSKIFHFHIFKEVPYLLICLSVIFFNLGNKTSFDFFPAILLEKGLSETEISVALGFVQLSDIVAKLFSGYLVDMTWFRRHLVPIFIFFQAVMASLIYCIPLGNDLPTISVVLVAYAFTVALVINQRLFVLLHLLSEEALSSSFGTLLAFQGIGNVVGPPLSGALKDNFGVYDYTYYTCAASTACAAFLSLVCHVIVTCRGTTHNGGSTTSTLTSDRGEGNDGFWYKLCSTVSSSSGCFLPGALWAGMCVSRRGKALEQEALAGSERSALLVESEVEDGPPESRP